MLTFRPNLKTATIDVLLDKEVMGRIETFKNGVRHFVPGQTTAYDAQDLAHIARVMGIEKPMKEVELKAPVKSAAKKAAPTTARRAANSLVRGLK